MENLRPFIDIVTVNYNGLEFLEDYFLALELLDYPKDKLRVFFADNASSDDSLGFVRSLKPGFSLEIIANGKNYGFARGNNLVFSRCKGEYIALLNNDTKVEKDWLTRLLSVMQSDPQVAMAGSRQLPRESSRRIDPLTLRTSWCSGGHCLIRRSVLDSVGYFDERFFMYGEDVDLSWRIWLAGYTCLYVPEAVCHHHYRGETPHSARRLYYHSRNSILLRYAYGERQEIIREIFRWVREGVACAVKRVNLKDACAILAAVLTHFLCVLYFLKKGRVLKATPRFKEIKQEWIMF